MYVSVSVKVKRFNWLQLPTLPTNTIFTNEFNETIFREELSYFDNIDYSEEVDYMTEFKVEDDVVKGELSELSLQKV